MPRPPVSSTWTRFPCALICLRDVHWTRKEINKWWSHRRRAKTRITAVLTCFCTGIIELAPVVVAKSESQVRNCQKNIWVKVYVLKEAFMNTSKMRSWLSEQLLSSYLDPVTDCKLLLDRAPTHIASTHITWLKSIHSLVIPRRCTPLLELVNVGINKMFEDH